MTASTKRWGDQEFWGLGFDFDPQWLLNERQRDLQARLIELCANTLRANAIESDRRFLYPRRNFEALARLGVLGLLVPRALGGLGESHQCAAMVTETIARYGCPSTAMCYTMHNAAVSALLLRHHDNPLVDDLLSRLDRDCLVGTLSYSDPQTGGHLWFPMSSSAERVEGGWRIHKRSSWTTSGGFADWYLVQTTSPGFSGDYSDLSSFLLFGDEVESDPESWDGLGLHGNQSGPISVDGRVVPEERLVGRVGDGARSNDEAVMPFFLLGSSACWNGISLALIDITRRHTTTRQHADLGVRVADYPTIQDYVGEAIIDTSAARALALQVAQALDLATGDCDWEVHRAPAAAPRRELLHWLWQVKFTAAKNVTAITDRMLHACGGSGYKSALGIERYLRDGKAGWVMGPSNEVLRQFVGRLALFGPEAIDYWNRRPEEAALQRELKKLDAAAKRRLAERLLREARAGADDGGTAGE